MRMGGDRSTRCSISIRPTIIRLVACSREMCSNLDYGVPTDSGTTYLTADHLGSTRLLTNGSGAVKKRYDYFPFGEDIQANLGRSAEDYGSGMYPSPPGLQSMDFTREGKGCGDGAGLFWGAVLLGRAGEVHESGLVGPAATITLRGSQGSADAQPLRLRPE
jgi:hypothetical protein